MKYSERYISINQGVFNFQEVLAWCGELNAHNTLWVNETTDNNSQVIEALLDENNLVCFGNEVAVTNRETCYFRTKCQ